MKNKRKFNKNRFGFSLLEVGLGIGISMLAMTYFMYTQTDNTQLIKDKAIADKMNLVSQAATKYMQSNISALVQAVPTGSGAISIPVAKTDPNGSSPSGLNSNLPSLQGGGFLPESFVDAGFNGQHLALLIQQPTSGNLEAIVTTYGGVGLKDKDLGRIVQYIGGAGGAVMNNNVGNSQAGSIVGNGGAWGYNAGTWSSGYAPTAGHVVSNLSFYANTNLSDYLYRHDIGIPEANRMHTAIDFNNNNANNVNTTDTQELTNNQGTNNGSVLVGTTLQGNYQVNTGYNSGKNGATSYGGVNSGGGAVGFKQGIYACTDDATGCGVQVSDDGGFYDNNDSWISYQGGGAGIHLVGSNNNLKVDNHIGAAGYSPTETLPNGIQGGISTWDLVAHGGNYVINSSTGNVGAYMIGTEVGLKDDSGTQSIAYFNKDSQGRGQSTVTGRMGTMGYTPGQGDPSTWGGGLTTWDVVAHGTVGSISNSGAINATLGGSGSVSSGSIEASQWTQGQVLRPTYVATAGDECGTVAPYNISGTFTDAASFAVQNGDIARDSDGNPLTCVNGTWKGNTSFTRSYQSTFQTGVVYKNNDGLPMYIATNCQDSPLRNGFASLIDVSMYDANGNSVSSVHTRIQEGGSDSNFGMAPFASFIVPPNYSFRVTQSYGQRIPTNMTFCSAMVVE